MKTITATFKSFFKLLDRGNWGINVSIGIHSFRFCHSLIEDILWYKEPIPRAILVSVLATLLWSAWLHRPWGKKESYA